MFTIIRTGWQGKIRTLQDVPLQGPNGEALFVGRKVRTGWFMLPLVFEDEGYVLGVKGGNAYFPLPQGPALTGHQQSGNLPNPLPEYHKARDVVPVILAWLFILLIVGVKLFAK